jgi:hypothetical protein
LGDKILSLIDSASLFLLDPAEMDVVDECLSIKNHETEEMLDINYFWLRDHCRCEDCYNVNTCQKRLSILDIPEDVRPNSWKLDSGNLSVFCEFSNIELFEKLLSITILSGNDGHKSVYEMDFILSSTQSKTIEIFKEERSRRVFWTKEIVESSNEIARIPLNSLLCHEEMIKSVVESLVKFGVAFIENVPANQQSTEIAIKLIFPIHKTFFGEMWTFSDTNMDHSDTAYTKEYLGLHNDTTYFNDACGLQILHCIQLNATGGDTILVDGFKVAENMRDEDEDRFKRLCEYPIVSEYIEEGKHHSYCAPILKTHPVSGETEQIR